MEKSDLKLIKDYQRELTLFGYTCALIDWDQQVNMPKKGVGSRAEISAFLGEMAHEKVISEEFFSAISRLNAKKLKGDDGLIVSKLYKDVSKSRKIPKELVSEMARATAMGHSAWEKARAKKDFSVYRKPLEKIVELKRKQASLIGLEGHPYNSLLDDFEEGMTAEKLIPVFKKLKKELVSLLRKIERSKTYKNQHRVHTLRAFDKGKQELLVRDVAKRMGLKDDFSRIDISEHPFTTKVGVDDIRFTVAYRENPLFAFESGVHEAGHALYESGLPKKHAYDALGDAPSLGIHESQSRFWENMIAKGVPFWKFYFDKFDKAFGLGGDFEGWFKEVNYIEPGMIRVESDEVHYCLHVILRFEIELGLLDGSIKVADLPKIWNRKAKEVFGRAPKNDVEGVLQDVHWSGGAIGYFPTYALGTIYAAQLYEFLRKKYSWLEKDIAKGDYSRIRKWLRKNIHEKSSTMLADDIIKKATGKGLNPDAYVKYLNRKYKQIYGF